MELPKGGTLGIIGATDSGKFTLVKLLLRFYDVSKEAINPEEILVFNRDRGVIFYKVNFYWKLQLYICKNVKSDNLNFWRRKMIKAIYFDLFFTLIVPKYKKANNEFDILDLSVNEWENYAESDVLYQERALGLVKSEKDIIDKIVSTIPFDISDIQKEKVLLARENRMKAALQNISMDIFDVLKKLKDKNIKLGLISNADVIDCKYWNQSQLSSIFDDAIFSCNVGVLKPDRKIYELAMQHLNVLPSECLFVGDGGSNELCGAKSVGMKTVFTEALEVKTDEKRIRIMEHADYYVKYFREILNCI